MKFAVPAGAHTPLVATIRVSSRAAQTDRPACPDVFSRIVKRLDRHYQAPEFAASGASNCNDANSRRTHSAPHLSAPSRGTPEDIGQKAQQTPTWLQTQSGPTTAADTTTHLQLERRRRQTDGGSQRAPFYASKRNKQGNALWSAGAILNTQPRTAANADVLGFHPFTRCSKYVVADMLIKTVDDAGL